MKNDEPQDQFCGFSSAGANGRKITLSKEALTKAKNLFLEECHEEPIIDPQPKQFDGFSSGKGLKISISEEALAKGKQIFIEDDKDLKTREAKKETRNGNLFMKCDEPQAQFSGFSSAGAKGQKITFSKEAVAKAKNLLLEEPKEEPIRDPQFLSGCEKDFSMQLKQFDGFSSATGKKISISMEALEKGKQIFVEGDIQGQS